MTAEPEGQRAAAAAGRLRTARSDREQAIDVLKAAFVQGRMSKDEFDARVGRAFASRTYAELAAVTADIPAGQTRDQPPLKAAQAQSLTPTSQAAKARRYMVIAVAMTVLFTLASDGPALLLFAPLCLAVWALAGAQLFAARREKRGSRQLPGPPAARSQAPETGPPAGSG